MELALHANATTTPKIRSYIQRSKKPVAELATELGVCETTIRRWRGRTTVGDRSRRWNTGSPAFAGDDSLGFDFQTSTTIGFEIVITELDPVIHLLRRGL